LSRRLRDICGRPWIGKVEGTHSIDVATREAGQARELPLDIGGQTVDCGRPPTFSTLAFDNISAEPQPSGPKRAGTLIRRTFIRGAPREALCRLGAEWAREKEGCWWFVVGC